MMRFRFLLALLVLTASLSFAQRDDLPIVKEIKIVNLGSGKLDENYIKAHTNVKKDSQLDHMLVASDVRKLLATERFSDVKAELEPVDGGVRLVYSFRNKFRLAEPVKVLGFDNFSEERIRNFLDIYPGDLVDMQVLEYAGLKVVKEYREDYYLNTELNWKIDETDSDEGLAKAILTIKEGKRSKVKNFLTEGNEEVSSRALRSILKRRRWWDPRWLFRKKRYTEEELEAARIAVRDYYLNRGFLDVDVDYPLVTENKNGSLQVVMSIDEGAKYRLGDVAVEGVSLFPESKIVGLLFLKTGAVASSADFERQQMTIRDYYGERGYINTVVHLSLKPDAKEGTVDAVFSITEGQLTQIRNIKILGNTRTKDKVIRRELLVDPGDIYNEVKVRRSRLIVSNLGFFSTVRMRPVDTSLPDFKDIFIDVEEKPTGNLMMGAGFSSIDKVMGFIELSQGNFDITNLRHPTGGGQKLKLRAQFGSERKIYELSFVEPWFLDRKLSFGVDLFRTDISSSDYEVQRTGGALSLAKKLPGPNRITCRYELEKISSITDTNLYYFLGTDEEADFVEDSRVQSTFKVSITHNTCNNPFVPTRGTRASIYGSVSGGPLGFDTDIYTLGVKSAHYFPLWFGHVFSIRGQCEVVDTFDDTIEVPYSERLFIGGGRTIRGFDYRDVGPKVLLDPFEDTGAYKAYGGSSLLYGSLGYTIPVVNGIRIAFFYDVGNVWRDVYEFSGHNLASSVGTGLRLDVPGFPIRLDRAWVLEKDEDITNEDKWAIWIGHDF